MAAVFPQAAVEHHNRLLALLDDLIHLFHAQEARIDNHRVAAHIEQVLDRLALFIRAVLAVREDQLPPLFFRHARGVKQQFAKVDAVIEGVRHHQSQRLGTFGCQVSRQQIRAIAALFNGLKHPVFGLLADVAISRQHPGHRGFRNACPLRHFKHRGHSVIPSESDGAQCTALQKNCRSGEITLSIPHCDLHHETKKWSKSDLVSFTETHDDYVEPVSYMSHNNNRITSDGQKLRCAGERRYQRAGRQREHRRRHPLHDAAAFRTERRKPDRRCATEKHQRRARRGAQRQPVPGHYWQYGFTGVPRSGEPAAHGPAARSAGRSAEDDLTPHWRRDPRRADRHHVPADPGDHRRLDGQAAGDDPRDDRRAAKRRADAHYSDRHRRRRLLLPAADGGGLGGGEVQNQHVGGHRHCRRAGAPELYRADGESRAGRAR